MKLKEIFDQLTYGELSQLGLGGGTIGEVDEDDHGKVATLINLGLVELHKRFLIREGEVSVPVVADQRTYVLTEDDLYKIEQVYLDDDSELGLNDPSDDYTARTTGYRTLVVPERVVTAGGEYWSDTLRVVYRTGPTLLTASDWSTPETCEVDLPYMFLEALLYYVASRATNATGFSSGNGFHEGNNYFGKFEASCALLEAQAFQLEKGATNTKLEQAGFV